MSKKPPSSFGKSDAPASSNWKLFLGIIVAFFLIKALFFSSTESKRDKVIYQPATHSKVSQQSAQSTTPLANLSDELVPPLQNDNFAVPTDSQLGVGTYTFEARLQSAYADADKASNVLNLNEPNRASKDIHALLGERFSDNASSYLKSDDFKIIQFSPLSLYEASRILANTYLIAEFEAGKEDDWIGGNLNSGQLFYRSSDSQYRIIPKLNFQVGEDSYLVYDRLRNEGQYSDCHACQAALSVIRYHSPEGILEIDNLYETVATLGTWGNTGVVQPVKFSDGEFGFIVTNGTINQGILSSWIDAFKVSKTGITKVPNLSKSKIEDPQAVDENAVYEQAAELPVEMQSILDKAVAGDAESQFAIGVLYDFGHEDFAQDHIKAAKWYEMAAVQGTAKAQHNLAVLYHDGQGVTKNYEQSYFWLLLASKTASSNSIHLRDEVERQLTAEQIADVQKRAIQWSVGKAFADLKPINVSSFDCGKAKTSIEIVICSETKLATLDKNVAEAYILALQLFPKKKVLLKNEQRNFLKTRLTRCPISAETLNEVAVQRIVNCLTTEYETRLAALGRYVPSAMPKKSLFSKFFKPRDRALND